MIHAYVFTVFHGLLFVLWCRRERAIREMRRIHAEQLAAERRSSMHAIARLSAERDAYRDRYLGVMRMSVMDLEEWS